MAPPKGLTLALLIALPFSTASAQKRKTALAVEPCTRTIDQVPELRGLRLGQPHGHLKTILPTWHDYSEPDEYGIRRVHLYPLLTDSRERLAGVQSIALVYFDDILKSIEIVYTREIEWQSNLHFVAAVAEQLKLPREGWLQRDPSYLICRGFTVEVAHATIMPTLRIVDFRLAEDIEKRRAEVEEKKRARFRP